MDRYPKDEATTKNFVWNESSSHSQEKLEKPVEGWMPPPIGGFDKPMTDQALLNLLVSAAENCEFMIHAICVPYSRTCHQSGYTVWPSNLRQGVFFRA